jgi:hypothetical protein
VDKVEEETLSWLSDELVLQADRAFWKVYEANIDDDMGEVLGPIYLPVHGCTLEHLSHIASRLPPPLVCLAPTFVVRFKHLVQPLSSCYCYSIKDLVYLCCRVWSIFVVGFGLSLS